MAKIFQKYIVSIQKKYYLILKKRTLGRKKLILGKKIEVNKWTFLEGKNRVGDRSNIESSYLGYGSYIGSDCKLVNTHVGRYCSIASSVGVIAGNHPIDEYISTSPFFYSRDFGGGFSYVDNEFFQVYRYADNEKKYIADIGNDVWIGEGVKILNGIRVGNGVVIGAYSLVTRDLEAYGVYAGIPARLIRYRYPENVRKILENFKWWDKGEKWLFEHSSDFRHPKEFIKKMEKEYDIEILEK